MNKSKDDVEYMVYGGDGVVRDLICGYLDFGPLQYFGKNAVFTGLPKVLVLDTAQSPRLETLLLWIHQENGQMQSGSDIAISHLLELLLLELFRSLDHVELALGCWKCPKPFLLRLSISRKLLNHEKEAAFAFKG